MDTQREPGLDPVLSIVDRFETWLERGGATDPADTVVLERVRHALRTTAGASGERAEALHIGDPALLEVVLSDNANRADRARAIRLLGLDDTKEVRVIAVSTSLNARRLLHGVCPGLVLRTSRHRLRAAQLGREPGGAGRGRVAPVRPWSLEIHLRQEKF